MKYLSALYLVLTLTYYSCRIDNSDSIVPDCDKNTVIIFEKPITFKMDNTTNPLTDTCFYWDLVNAYVLKLEITSPNENKPLGSIYFKNPFIVSVNIGVKSPTSGDFDIERPFKDPSKLVSQGKACMIVDGNQAINGKITFSLCDQKEIVNFKNIDFVTTKGDTVYSLSGQIICKK